MNTKEYNFNTKLVNKLLPAAPTTSSKTVEIERKKRMKYADTTLQENGHPHPDLWCDGRAKGGGITTGGCFDTRYAHTRAKLPLFHSTKPSNNLLKNHTTCMTVTWCKETYPPIILSAIIRLSKKRRSDVCYCCMVKAATTAM